MTSFDPGDLEQQLVRDRWLRQLAARLVWEGVDADDVPQEAWLAALRRPPRMDDGSGARGWFARVLRNAARDGHRRWRRRREHEGNAASEARQATRPGDPDGCPSDALLALEQRKTLLAEVERLAEPFRSAIVTRYLECGSETEAAARLGVPLETLRSRLKRGRELLRTRLEQRLGGAPALFAFVSSLATGSAPIAPLSPTSLAMTSSTPDLYATLTMKSTTKLALASLALLVTVGVGVVVSQPQDNASNVTQALIADADELAVLAPPSGSSSEADAQSTRQAVATPSPDGAVAPPELALAVVLGRVVDEQGRPLPGGTVLLMAGQALAMDRGLPLIDPHRKLVGAEATTDADGNFRVAAPLSLIRGVTLRVHGGVHRSFRRIHFGSDRELGLPALSTGETDIGEVQLGVTGAVQGVVVDAEGRALSDVEVDLGPTSGSSYGMATEVWTDARGAFFIPHAPIGVHWLNLSLAGFSRLEVERVRVEPHATMTCAPFTLERAATLAGLVRATDGAPVEGVQVHAWPHGDGSPVGARTGDDGRFNLALWNPVPHQLELTKEGFAPQLHVQEQENSTYYAPGTTDIEVMLTAADGPGRVRSQTRPAPPSGSVRGRVLHGDTPVAGARVRIAARGSRSITLRQADNSRESIRSVFTRRTIEFVVAKAAHAAFAQTDAEGRFEAEGAHVDPLHVTVLRPGKAPHVHLPDRHTGGTERDLGDICVLEGGSIDGTVLVPPGVDPIGLVVEVDEATTHTDGEGRFRLTGVPAGERHVVLNGRTGALEDGAATSVTVEPGATAEVVLDARLFCTCEVELRISVNGAPAEGARATLHDKQLLGMLPKLDPCDASGVARGFVRALHPATLMLHVPDVGRLDVREPLIELIPGARVEHTFELECGDLELLLPPSVELPTAGRIRLALSVDGDEPRLREVQSGSDGLAEGATCVDRRLRAPLFLTGRYRLEVAFTEDAAGSVKVPLANGWTTWRRVSYFEWSGDVEFRRGEVSVVDLARQ